MTRRLMELVGRALGTRVSGPLHAHAAYDVRSEDKLVAWWVPRRDDEPELCAALEVELRHCITDSGVDLGPTAHAILHVLQHVRPVALLPVLRELVAALPVHDPRPDAFYGGLRDHALQALLAYRDEDDRDVAREALGREMTRAVADSYLRDVGGTRSSETTGD